MGDQWHPTQEKYDKINLIKIDCELRGTWGGGATLSTPRIRLCVLNVNDKCLLSKMFT